MIDVTQSDHCVSCYMKGGMTCLKESMAKKDNENKQNTDKRSDGNYDTFVIWLRKQHAAGCG